MTLSDARSFTEILREDEGCHCNGLECPAEAGDSVSAEFLKPGNELHLIVIFAFAKKP